MLRLSEVSLPPFMPAALADELSVILTGALLDAPIQQFCALSLLYASWNGLSVDVTLADAAHHISELAKTHTAESLIEWLADPRTYLEAFNGTSSQENDASPLLVWQAVQSAATWRDRIQNGTPGPTGCLLQFTGLFGVILSEDSFYGTDIAMELEDAISAYLGTDDPDDNSDSSNNLTNFSSAAVKSFGTPEELLAYVKSQQKGVHLDRIAPISLGYTPPVTAAPTLLVPDPSSILCFSPEEAKLLLSRTSQRPGESTERQVQILKGLSAESGYRSLTQITNERAIDSLYSRFPHFKDVLDFIRANIALAASGDEGAPLRFPPILLRGVPGTGKSFFAEELATTLGGVFENRDLSVMTEAFVLAGHDASWKGAKTGVVFDAVVLGKVANPIICLDEVDKCSARNNFNSPISALYSLLEPNSARRFQDEFLPLRIDASKINWILTSNMGEIPEPILTRTEIFDIREPTHEECQAIGKSVWKFICETVLPKGHMFSTELAPDILEILVKMTPRIMKKALTFTAAQAAVLKKSAMEPQALLLAQKRYEGRKQQRIGF